MRVQKLPLADTRSFSTFFLDYIQQKESLQKFYSRFPEVKNFAAQIKEKSNSFPAAHREVLADTLQKQYKGLTLHESVKQSIQQLRDSKTFTITTGHQLNIFTGPLYFIYKIVTVINACRELKKQYPQHNFVPVYWMASEDHDYEEIKYFRLYGKKHVWITDQQGAVGRFNPKGMDVLLSQIPGDITLFKTAYLKHNTLSDAVRYYVNELFGAEGLVTVDADDRSFKRLFQNVITDDLFNHAPKTNVEEQNEALKELGYDPQVFARDINFFYLDKNVRGRIESNENGFSVIDTALKFSKEEVRKMIEEEPEKFSPNVILRPLYQEVILPNLAYAGGPAEVVYWLQLKKVFDHFKVPFPMLMPRNFASVIEKNVAEKFSKTGLEYKHLFEEKNFLFNQWVVKNSTHDLSLGKEMTALKETLAGIRDRASKIDPTLLKYVEAQAHRTTSGLEKIEHKMLRAEKRHHDDRLRQLEAVKDALFPNGSPQERVDNFLNFYQRDSTFIKSLLKLFDPFDFRFNLLFYEEG